VSGTVLVAVIAALAVGTYGFRLAGILLRDRLDLPDRVRRVLPVAAAALLSALAATATLFTQAGAAAGVARPAGVLVGAVLAWRKAPFVVVVIAAAATAALLRLAGVD
jgi:branched-subunit amino acid transport protein